MAGAGSVDEEATERARRFMGSLKFRPGYVFR